ncbi:MAG: hypothetical protein R3C26_21235 [Calditrichia bacterium]
MHRKIRSKESLAVVTTFQYSSTPFTTMEQKRLAAIAACRCVPVQRPALRSFPNEHLEFGERTWLTSNWLLVPVCGV